MVRDSNLIVVNLLRALSHTESDYVKQLNEKIVENYTVIDASINV